MMHDEVVGGLWRIPVPLPFRPRIVHAYLARLEEGGWLLVDGGIATEEAWAALEGAVLDVAGSFEALALHVVTHMHMDHIGLCARVREAGGPPLAMGRLDAERAAHAAAHPEEEAEYRSRLLRDNGAPEEVVVGLERSRGEARELAPFVPIDHFLPQANTPLPASSEWSSVWTPGHTAGHVSLFRHRDRILLGGDAILPRISPTIGVNRQRPDPVGDYLGALARVDDLRPGVVLGGHGDPLHDPSDRIAQLRAELHRETERVAALLGPAPLTAWDASIARYAGRELPVPLRVQAFRETLAHLDHLVLQRRATAETHSAGVRRFRAAAEPVT